MTDTHLCQGIIGESDFRAGVNVGKVLAKRNLNVVVTVLAIAFAIPPVSSAMAQSRGGVGVHGGTGGGRGGPGGFRGGYGGFRGGYGGFHGYGRPGVGFYFGGPYFGWPYYYGFPYGYPYPYGYYYSYPYPYSDDGYAYPPQPQTGPATAPEDHWYYCDDPKGYYPYVASCNGQWREVSPTPVPPRPSAP